MDWYSFFKDFAGPISTGLAALSAAFITGIFAYRQSRSAELQAQIALDKLKFETFEERHDVLDACRDMAQLYSRNPSHIISTADIVECAMRSNKGMYYFCDEINVVIQDYIDKAVKICAMHNAIQHYEHGDEKRIALENALVAMQANIESDVVTVAAALQSDLSLNLLKRGSKLERNRARR